MPPKRACDEDDEQDESDGEHGLSGSEADSGADSDAAEPAPALGPVAPGGLTEETYVITRILQHKGKGPALYYEIEWDGEWEDTWEPAACCDGCDDVLNAYWSTKTTRSYNLAHEIKALPKGTGEPKKRGRKSIAAKALEHKGKGRAVEDDEEFAPVSPAKAKVNGPTASARKGNGRASVSLAKSIPQRPPTSTSQPEPAPSMRITLKPPVALAPASESASRPTPVPSTSTLPPPAPAAHPQPTSARPAVPTPVPAARAPVVQPTSAAPAPVVQPGPPSSALPAPARVPPPPVQPPPILAPPLPISAPAPAVPPVTAPGPLPPSAPAAQDPLPISATSLAAKYSSYDYPINIPAIGNLEYAIQGHLYQGREREYGPLSFEWDELVKSILACSNEQGEVLACVAWRDGSYSWVLRDIVRWRAPQKLIEFYERHLHMS